MTIVDTKYGRPGWPRVFSGTFLGRPRHYFKCCDRGSTLKIKIEFSLQLKDKLSYRRRVSSSSPLVKRLRFHTKHWLDGSSQNLGVHGANVLWPDARPGAIVIVKNIYY